MPYMKIVLAPMDGLADDVMRAVITQVADVDWCVTEFVRITDMLLPPKVYWRLCPELLHGSKTKAGVPVRVQLLGSDPVCLAENAARAAELGSPVVDLNFGCPAPTVNRHRGGAILLKEPELLFAIATTVRNALPADVPLTAKMRLGYEDKPLAIDCAQALEAGGICELVVHARTKIEAYRPPAHWSWIAKIKENVQIPVIANGEIWTVADYETCRADSGIDDIMIGRGLIANPDLARQIRESRGHVSKAPCGWPELVTLLNEYYAYFDHKHAPGRLKMWLKYLAMAYPEAQQLLPQIRAENNAQKLGEMLKQAQDRELVNSQV